MKWLSLGIAGFLSLLIIGITTAALVKTPRRSLLPYFEIKPNQDILDIEFDQSDLHLVEFDRIADLSYGPDKVRNLLDIYLQP